MTESAHNPFFLPCLKLILLSNNSFDYTLKVFGTYYVYYKEKCIITKFIYDFNLFHKSDCITASFFANNGNVYTTEPGIITKKGEPLETCLYIFS